MTASQGMMLSERPAGSVLGGSVTAAGPSLGNYKGVMLCNRPFGGVAAAARDSADAGAAAVAAGRFVTGAVKTELGYAAPQRVRDVVVVRQAKKKTALSRHRRWLADLQRTKDNLEQQYMAGVQHKEDASRRFAEREAKNRHTSLGVSGALRHGTLHDTSDNNENSETKQHTADVEEHVYDAEAESKQAAKLTLPRVLKSVDDADIGLSSTSAIQLRKAHNKASKRKVKPLWALTQTDAAAVEAQAEENEVNELLAFTKDLDFDKYIHDAEVQIMIDQVKRRIQELEKQEAIDEQHPEVDDDGTGVADDDDDATVLDSIDHDELRDDALGKRIMRLTDANLKRIGHTKQQQQQQHGDDYNDDDAESILSLAKTVLSEGGRSVRTIHSIKSLAAVVSKSQTKLGCINETTAAAAADTASNAMETAVNVRMILHKEDGGLRLGGKNTVSNLPYIHRNPAI